MDYAMFSEAGNVKVAEIVTKGLDLKVNYDVETVWNWALDALERLARIPEFEEATDTAVREVVYDRLVCG
jgi:hypothetical protein|tara:strand:+ start:2732 stop:2941 length:210 start_codon:yes stop_codon:yes gene_type:complete